MLNVTRLLCGTSTPGDALRYGEEATSPHHIRAPSAHFRPVVVWNVTRRCNLRCLHCYTSSNEHPARDELNHQEAQAVVDDLAAFKVPVILFSGGEPLIREDVFDLMAQSASLEVQPVLSTNGTLIDAAMTDRLREAGVTRVGISIDGLESTNDGFRQMQGAFQKALDGIRASQEAGFRVSLRFTMTRYNVHELDDIFALVEEMGIPRVCIYHVAYSGRGRRLLPIDLQHEERRDAVGRIFQHTLDMHSRGNEVEVLTVDNHTDAAYLLLWAQENAPDRVPEMERLLTRNGGNSAGKGIGNIDERGNVHPDPFWRSQTLGNVRERPFSAIWQDDEIPLLRQLRSRHDVLPRMCNECRFLPVCNGNLRARAEAATGDPWGEDPACYLTEEERVGIGETVTA